MYLEDKVGSIAPGMEADIVVLDMKSTLIVDYRMRFVEDIHEALFVQMTLGDDRAVQATYVAGCLRYERQPGRA
jgi:guanine deaminase